ncbi:MAG TPA: MgtC/SapB family protein [Gammaproteobacteria bacterium]|jgi:putative Mg2+ transporter-C (MgtC) family protein
MQETVLLMLSIEPLIWKEIGTATACGVILGFERQLKGKPAGMRTSILICLGTYIFVKLGSSVAGDSTGAVRAVGQVVTGIGFLGAGVILARDGILQGVTSAAVIWILAALGAMIGRGYCGAPIMVTLLVVIVLTGVDQLEKTFGSLRKGVHAKIDGQTNPPLDK